MVITNFANGLRVVQLNFKATSNLKFIFHPTKSSEVKKNDHIDKRYSKAKTTQEMLHPIPSTE